MQYEKFLCTVDMWVGQKRKISISHGDLGNYGFFSVNSIVCVKSENCAKRWICTSPSKNGSRSHIPITVINHCHIQLRSASDYVPSEVTDLFCSTAEC